MFCPSKAEESCQAFKVGTSLLLIPGNVNRVHLRTRDCMSRNSFRQEDRLLITLFQLLLKGSMHCMAHEILPLNVLNIMYGCGAEE